MEIIARADFPTGVSPMGLFWSMRAAPRERRGTRLMKCDASSPLNVDVKVCDGHFSFRELYTNNIRELARIRFRRWYMAKNVRKIKVRSGRIRGYLFLPKGILDLFLYRIDKFCFLLIERWRIILCIYVSSKI